MWHCLSTLADVSHSNALLFLYKLTRFDRGGIIAPFLGGFLLMIDRTIPVYFSVVIFAIAGFCVLLLKEDAGDSTRDRSKTDRVFVH